MHCIVDDNLRFDVDWQLLHSVSMPVDPAEDISPLIHRLVYGVRALNGVGLAAVQIGEAKRAFVAVSGIKIIPYINPVLIRHGRDVETDVEGCLSTDGHVVHVERFRIVEIKYERWPDRRVVTDRFTGKDARVMQHELDHLDGKLIVDLLP